MKTFQNKKTLTQGTSLGVLTKQRATKLAVLNFGGCAITPGKSNRVQILPDGYFIPTDGREVAVEGGKWLMDEHAFASLTAHSSLRKNDFMFDYEHQTLFSEQNGKPAPAAGWFKKLDYVPGVGLFALDVDWTPTATKHILDNEYRYTSAVFSYDPKTGRPIQLLHVALTNEPALDGMKAIAALKTTNHLTGNFANSTGEIPMKKALTMILDWLDVAHTDEDLSDTAALTTIQDKAKKAIDSLKSQADKSDKLATDLTTAQTAVTALKATAANTNGAVDLAKFVPVATYNAAITQVAALKASGDSNSVEQLLKDNTDKVFESEIGYLTAFGKQQGFAALKSMIAARPAIAALTTTQTQGKQTPGKKVVALTREQQYTADQLGLSHKDFIATLNKETH